MTKSKIDMYIHGRSTKYGQGGWGALLHNKTKPKNKAMYGGAIRYASDSLMEIMSAIQSLGALNKPCDVTIYTESKLLFDIIKNGIIPKEHKTLALELLYFKSFHDITVNLLNSQNERDGGNPKVYNLVHEGIQEAKELYRLNRGLFDRLPNHF